jgi:hypothetical protein
VEVVERCSTRPRPVHTHKSRPENSFAPAPWSILERPDEDGKGT